MPVYSSPTTGRFHRLLLSGEYTVKVTADGYKPGETTITVTEYVPQLSSLFILPAEGASWWSTLNWKKTKPARPAFS